MVNDASAYSISSQRTLVTAAEIFTDYTLETAFKRHNDMNGG